MLKGSKDERTEERTGRSSSRATLGRCRWRSLESREASQSLSKNIGINKLSNGVQVQIGRPSLAERGLHRGLLAGVRSDVVEPVGVRGDVRTGKLEGVSEAAPQSL